MDPGFWTGRGCVFLFGVFLAFIGVVAGLFYTWQRFTEGLLLVIIVLLACILFVQVTKGEH